MYAIPINKSERAIGEIQTLRSHRENAAVKGIQDWLGDWAIELNLAVWAVGVNGCRTYPLSSALPSLELLKSEEETT